MASGTISTGPQTESAPAQGRYEDFIETRLEQTRHQVRLVEVASGLMLLAAASLLFFLGVAVLDQWVFNHGLNFIARLGLFLVWVAGAGVFVWRFLLPPLANRINPVFAAQAIEKSRPTLKNSLINFLLLRRHQQDVMPVVYRAMEHRAAADLLKVKVEHAVDHSRMLHLAYLLGGVVVVFAIYLAISPKSPLVSAARVIWPWSSIPAPTRVRIDEIRPGDAIVFTDDRQEITAQVTGLRDGEDVALLVSTADGQVVDDRVPMTAVDDAHNYRCELPEGAGGFQQDTFYRITAGDATTQQYKLEAQIAPTIAVDRIDYRFPAYTELKDRTVANQGDIKALEGTQVTIHATANMDIKDARIDLNRDGLQSFAMTTNGQQAVGKLTLPLYSDDTAKSQYESYQVFFTGVNGHIVRRPIVYHIDVDRDLKPEITIVEPHQEESEVAVNGELSIRLHAFDPDFALRHVSLQGERQPQGGGDAENLALPVLLERIKPDKAWAKPFDTEYVFRPADWNLKVGDEVRYWATADDNKEPRANHSETSHRTIRIIAPGQASPPDQQSPSNAGSGQPQPNQSKQGKGGTSGNKPQNGQGDSTNKAESDGQQGDANSGQNAGGQKQETKTSDSKQGDKSQQGQPDKGGAGRDKAFSDSAKNDKNTEKNGEKSNESSSGENGDQPREKIAPDDKTRQADLVKEILKDKEKRDKAQQNEPKNQPDQSGSDQKQQPQDSSKQNNNQQGKPQEGDQQQGDQQQNSGQGGQQKQGSSGGNQAQNGKSGNQQNQSGGQQSGENSAGQNGPGQQDKTGQQGQGDKQGAGNQGGQKQSSQQQNKSTGSPSAGSQSQDKENAGGQSSNSQSPPSNGSGKEEQGKTSDGAKQGGQAGGDQAKSTAKQPGGGNNQQGQSAGGSKSEKPQLGGQQGKDQSAGGAKPNSDKKQSGGQQGKDQAAGGSDSQNTEKPQPGGKGPGDEKQVAANSPKSEQKNKPSGNESSGGQDMPGGEKPEKKPANESGNSQGGGQGSKAKPQEKQQQDGGGQSSGGEKPKPGQGEQPGSSSGGNKPGGSKPSSKAGSQGGASEGDQPGQKDPGNSGSATDQNSGKAPSPQTDNAPGEKKAGDSNNKGENPKDGQPPGNSEKTSNSQGESSGDRKGGGAGGGGGDQHSKKSGKGTPGSQMAADEGGKVSDEHGPGADGKKAGQATRTNDQTGSTAKKSGQGNGDKHESDNDQTAKEEAKEPKGNKAQNTADTQNKSNGGQSGEQSSQQGGSQGSGLPGGGSQAGKADSPAGTAPQQASGPDAANLDFSTQLPALIQPFAPSSGPDAANLDFSKKQVDLALEHLKEQMAKQKPELLDHLGWTKEEGQKFVDNLQKLKDSAKQSGNDGEAGKKAYNEFLKNLDLQPHGTQIRGQMKADDLQGVHDSGQMEPPGDWADLYHAYSHGTAGQK